jgi:TPR repeat protein
LGVARDFQMAAQWYRRAAEQGHAAAQNNLAHLYLNGEGVARDPREAQKWFERATRQANPSPGTPNRNASGAVFFGIVEKGDSHVV